MGHVDSGTLCKWTRMGMGVSGRNAAREQLAVRMSDRSSHAGYLGDPGRVCEAER